MVLLIILYNVILTFVSVDEILNCVRITWKLLRGAFVFLLLSLVFVFFPLSLNLGTHARKGVKSTCISADALQYEKKKNVKRASDLQ